MYYVRKKKVHPHTYNILLNRYITCITVSSFFMNTNFRKLATFFCHPLFGSLLFICRICLSGIYTDFGNQLSSNIFSGISIYIIYVLHIYNNLIFNDYVKFNGRQYVVYRAIFKSKKKKYTQIVILPLNFSKIHCLLSNVINYLITRKLHLKILRISYSFSY